MARIGADVEHLAQLESRFRTASEQVEELTRVVAQQLAGTDWEGPAAQRFHSAWTGDFEPALRRMRSALDDAAHEVKSEHERLIRWGG